MNPELNRIITFWEHKPSARALIHQGFDLTSVLDLKNVIEMQPALEQRRIQKILREIVTALELLSISLSDELKQMKRVIQQTEAAKYACLSYHQSQKQKGSFHE